ncbi:hypothetical protein CSUI_001644 [Cystoisospora suis]|uniref:Uncharacterized protein n=1 Tax=Cystoisospora suis TaxID=483139 RepID=A0A2C6KKC8_9APIC|nr:hypothetical protein CSUI_001644 [Cystoisospora suis]
MTGHTNADSSLPKDGRCVEPVAQTGSRPKKKAILFSSSSLQSAAAFSSFCSTALPSSADAGGVEISSASLLTTFRSYARSTSRSAAPHASSIASRPPCSALRLSSSCQSTSDPPPSHPSSLSAPRTEAEEAPGTDQSHLTSNKSEHGPRRGCQENETKSEDILPAGAREAEREHATDAASVLIDQEVSSQSVCERQENKEGHRTEAHVIQSLDAETAGGTPRRQKSLFTSEEEYPLRESPVDSGIAVLGEVEVRYVVIDAPAAPGTKGAHLPRSAAARLPPLGGRPAATAWWVTDDKTHQFVPVVRTDPIGGSDLSLARPRGVEKRDGFDREPCRGDEFPRTTQRDLNDERIVGGTAPPRNAEKPVSGREDQEPGANSLLVPLGAESAFSPESTSSITEVAGQLLQAETLVIFRCSSALAVFLPSGWPCVFLKETQRLFPLAERGLSKVCLEGDTETSAFFSTLFSEGEGKVIPRLHGLLHRAIENLLCLLENHDPLSRSAPRSHTSPVQRSPMPPGAPSASVPRRASAHIAGALSPTHRRDSTESTCPRSRDCYSLSSASLSCAQICPSFSFRCGLQEELRNNQRADHGQHKKKPQCFSEHSAASSSEQGCQQSRKSIGRATVSASSSIVGAGEEEISSELLERGDSAYITGPQDSTPTELHLPAGSAVEKEEDDIRSYSVASEFLFTSSPRRTDEVDSALFPDLEHPGMSPEDLRRQEIVEGIHDLIERARYHGLIRRERDNATGEVHEYIIPATNLDTQLNHIKPFSGSSHKIGWEHLLSWQPPSPQTTSEGEDDSEKCMVGEEEDTQLRGGSACDAEWGMGDRSQARAKEWRKPGATCKSRGSAAPKKDTAVPSANLRRQMYQDFLFV